MAGDSESLLKGPKHKILFAATYTVPGEGGHSGLEMLEDSLGLVALGRQLKEQPPGSLC